jgi:hypothetical protein
MHVRVAGSGPRRRGVSDFVGWLTSATVSCKRGWSVAEHTLPIADLALPVSTFSSPGAAAGRRGAGRRRDPAALDSFVAERMTLSPITSTVAVAPLISRGAWRRRAPRVPAGADQLVERLQDRFSESGRTMGSCARRA